MNINKNIFGIGILLSLLFGCIGSTEEVLFDETDVINDFEGAHWYFNANAGETVVVDIQVTEGGPVDVMFMDATGFGDYSYNLGGGVSDFESIDHSLNVKAWKKEIKVDSTEKYYLVVDNTDVPADGAISEGKVSVKVKVSIKS